MSKKNKIVKKIKMKKMKFVKELKFTTDVMAGGCDYTDFGCTSVR